MDCRTVDSWLPAFLENALPARRAQAIAQHLEECPRCQREQRTLEAALQALNRVGSRPPSIDLWASFHSRLTAEAARRGDGRPVPLFWRPLAAAAAVGVAAVSCSLSLRLSPPPPAPQDAASGTARITRTVPSDHLSRTASHGRPMRVTPLAALPPISSPEAEPTPGPTALLPPATEELAPPVVVALKVPGEAVGPPDREYLAALPAISLAEAVDALMAAPQDAAHAQVASEVILLAEEITRLEPAPRDGSGGA